MRNTNKTVSNYFAFPQINQAVHVVSNCEFVSNPQNTEIVQPIPQIPIQANNIRLQTKVTPIFTKNHGYPRLVQEFQFFLGESVIKFTNVTTSMPDRKDDAFMSQVALLNTQNQINDYYFDLSNNKEEGKIIEEEVRAKDFDPDQDQRPDCQPQANNINNENNKNSSSLFGMLHAKNYPFGENRNALLHSKTTMAGPIIASTVRCCEIQKLREEEKSSLSGKSLSPPPIPLEVSEESYGEERECGGDSSGPKEDGLHLWRGDMEIPDNKKSQVFKVVKKRICKQDRKLCEGQKLGCKVQ